MQFISQVAGAIHYAALYQYITIENAREPPELAKQAGTCAGVPLDERTGVGDNGEDWWDPDPEVKVMYHGGFASTAPNIALNGYGRGLGAGALHLQEVYGIEVEGAHFTDRFDTAFRHPIRHAAASGELYAGELIAEDGTLPVRVVWRNLCYTPQALFRRLEKTNRQWWHETRIRLPHTHLHCAAESQMCGGADTENQAH